MTKLKILQITLVLSFALFLIFLMVPKNYEIEYEVDEVKVKEAYNKKKKIYTFSFIYNDEELEYISSHKYMRKRKLVDNLKVINNAQDFCLIAKSKVDILPLCSQNKEEIYYELAEEELKEALNQEGDFIKSADLISTYNDFEIYNQDYNYLIWSYDGFYYLNKKGNKKIDLFTKEMYTVNLLGYTKDFLVVPDYDANYTFNKIYTINFKNGKVKEYKLKNNVYFDSYIMGYLNNKLYLVDKKEEKMYEFNAKNGKLTKMKPKVYMNGKWENEDIKNLINKEIKLQKKETNSYSWEDNKLYLKLNTKEMLVDQDVRYLVKIDNQDIFYLKGNDLYHFNLEKGREKLLSYLDWNFNYQNIIYLN